MLVEREVLVCFSGGVWCGIMSTPLHTAVGAFKRVLPLICDATFRVQRCAAFTVTSEYAAGAH